MAGASNRSAFTSAFAVAHRRLAWARWNPSSVGSRVSRIHGQNGHVSTTPQGDGIPQPPTATGSRPPPAPASNSGRGRRAPPRSPPSGSSGGHQSLRRTSVPSLHSGSLPQGRPQTLTLTPTPMGYLHPVRTGHLQAALTVGRRRGTRSTSSSMNLSNYGLGDTFIRPTSRGRLAAQEPISPTRAPPRLHRREVPSLRLVEVPTPRAREQPHASACHGRGGQSLSGGCHTTGPAGSAKKHPISLQRRVLSQLRRWPEAGPR